MTVDEYKHKYGTGCFDGFWDVGRVAGVPAIPVPLHTLIDETVKKLNDIYIPYVVSWVKQKKKDVWNEIMNIESDITVAVLCDDEYELRRLLEWYYDVWVGMIVEFEAGGRKYVPL